MSSNEAYASPTRGAQGNALKTILAMPYALHGEHGEVQIEAQGVRHAIKFAVDRIRQEPAIKADQTPTGRMTGTAVRTTVEATTPAWDRCKASPPRYPRNSGTCTRARAREEGGRTQGARGRSASGINIA